MSFRRPLAALALLVLLAPLPARAQHVSTADRALARSLALEGYDALDRKDYPAAVERFGRADALFHVASVALGLARAQVGVGQLVNAEETYARIVREGVPAGAPAALVRAVADARVEIEGLRPRIPGVIIKVAGASTAAVTLDGAPVSTAALGVRFPVDPGKHVLRATAPGLRAEVTVTLAEGKAEAVNLQLSPERVVPLVGAQGPPHPPLIAPVQAPVIARVQPPVIAPLRGAGGDTTPSFSTRKIAGVALMGAGAVGAVLYAVFTAEAHSKYAALNGQCPSHVGCSGSLASSLSSYHSTANTALASGIVGGALLGTGVVVYVTAPKTKPPASAFVAPRVGAGYLGVEGGF